MKSKERKRNTPIATLIKNYINKKSGKVPESRKEIQRRFDYLDLDKLTTLRVLSISLISKM